MCSYESFKLPKEPRERMFAILFLISLNPLFWGLFEQAGGSMNLFTDRFVDRSGVPAGDLPVDQPDLHHPARAAVRGAVAMAGQARQGALGPGQVRPGAAPDGPRQSGAGLGCGGLRRRGDDPGAAGLRLLPVRHHRRALPLAGRPLGDEPARAEVPRLADHGGVVLHDCGRQLRRRQDRRGDRRT